MATQGGTRFMDEESFEEAWEALNRRDGSANRQRESASIAPVPPWPANAPEGERVDGLGIATAT